MIPPVIHQIWLGGNIPLYGVQWMFGVVTMNPFFTYRLWDEERFKEEGIDIHQFDDMNTHPAGVSGGLRLVIIEKYGGVYLDCDVECIKTFLPLLPLSAFVAKQDHQLGNAVFGAVPHHPWIQWQLQHARETPERDAAWSTHLMERAPREGVTVLPNETFYPWTWEAPKDQRRITGETMAIHHWEGSWNK